MRRCTSYTTYSSGPQPGPWARSRSTRPPTPTWPSGVRPSSTVPAEVAGKLAGKAGVDLSGENETTQNRKSGLGALSGYAVGLGVGTTYGLLRPLLSEVSVGRAGLVLGLTAMAGSDVPAAALGVTDPTQWSLASWASDVVPHLAYGLMTAAAYEAFAG